MPSHLTSTTSSCNILLQWLVRITEAYFSTWAVINLRSSISLYFDHFSYQSTHISKHWTTLCQSLLAVHMTSYDSFLHLHWTNAGMAKATKPFHSIESCHDWIESGYCTLFKPINSTVWLLANQRTLLADRSSSLIIVRTNLNIGIWSTILMFDLQRIDSIKKSINTYQCISRSIIPFNVLLLVIDPLDQYTYQWTLMYMK